MKYSSRPWNQSCVMCECVLGWGWGGARGPQQCSGKGTWFPQTLPRVGPLTSPSLSGSSSLGKVEELDLRRDVGLGHQGPAWTIVPHLSGVDSWHFHGISSPTS